MLIHFQLISPFQLVTYPPFHTHPVCVNFVSFVKTIHNVLEFGELIQKSKDNFSEMVLLVACKSV